MTKTLSVLRHVAEWSIERGLPGKGEHRARRPLLLPDAPIEAPATPVHGTVADDATLDELLGPSPVPAWVGAVIVQRFDDCPACKKATAGVLTKDGWRCGECLTSMPVGSVS